MKKIMHIEDNSGWQMRVSEALAPIHGLDLVQFVSSREFMDEIYKGKPVADLYILDRHICETPKDYGPNDTSWKTVLNVISSLRAKDERRIIMLSNHVPKDIARYPGVIAGFPKQSFNPEYFRDYVRHCLGLNGGSE